MFIARDQVKSFLILVASAILMIMVITYPSPAVSETVGSTRQILPFKDLGNDDPDLIYIAYISQKGIIKGFPDGTYHPLEGLTRAQAAVMICKAAGISTPSAETSRFTDVPADHWAVNCINAAEKAGYLSGFPDGSYRPETSLTRAQSISLVMRLCTQKEKATLPALDDLDDGYWAAADLGTALALDMISLSKDGKYIYPDAEMSRGNLARALALLMTKDPGLSKVKLQGKLNEITGQVTLVRNGQSRLLTSEYKIIEGDQIETAFNSSARISYPDGSSNLLEANSVIKIKQSDGKRYIKKDGSEGIAVEYLNIALDKGTIYGTLAAKHGGAAQAGQPTEPETDIIKTSQSSRQIAALDGFKYLAAASSESPWYKTAAKKKVKVKVDMAWGVAAIRGTYVKITVNPDRTCRVSCLGGDAQLTGFTGDTITLTGNDTASVKQEGDSASKEGAMNAEDKAAFSEVKVQVFFIDASIEQDINQEVVAEPSQEQTYQDAASAVKAVVDALNNSGIKLDSEAIIELQDKIEEQLEQLDEKTVTVLQEQVQETVNQNPSDTNTHSSSSGSGGSVSITLSITDPTITLCKIYDGTTKAAVAAGTLSGVNPGDSLTVTASANYGTADVGTGKTITVVYTVAGPNAGDYTKPADFTVNTGVITAKQLTISAPTLNTNKTYDGSTTAVVSSGALSGVIGGDVVAVTAVANYNDANAGTPKPITVVYSLGGPKAGNYLAPVNYTEPNGTINRAPISITTITGLTAPVTGQPPDPNIDANVEYTGNVTWSPADSPYKGSQAYTATITLNSSNYEATGFGPNYFTVPGASSTTYDDAWTVTAVFPATAPGISTFASGFNNLGGADFDSAGNMYVADAGSHQVFKITPDGTVSPFAGTGTAGYDAAEDGGPATNAKLNGPVGVAVDLADNVYIADRDNGRIRVVTPGGTISSLVEYGNISSPTAANSSFDTPSSLDFDSSGNLYLLCNMVILRLYQSAGSWYSEVIVEYDNPSAKISTLAALISTIAADDSGNVYAGGYLDYRIYKLNQGVWTYDTYGAGDGDYYDGTLADSGFGNDLAVAVDGNNRLFFVDRSWRCVRMNQGGNIVLAAGTYSFINDGDGGPAVNAGIYGCSYVSFDSVGNMYIMCGDRIRKVTPIP